MAQRDKEKWDKKYQKNPISNKPIKLLVDYAGLAKNSVALDIACGMGRHSKYLASQGFKVDALDISSFAIESLQQIQNIHAKEVDFDTYTLPKAHYDLIVCTLFLKRKLLAQTADALKENGILIYETFVYHPDNTLSPSNRSFLLEEGELKNFFSDRLEIIHLQEYWETSIRDEKSMKVSMVAQKPALVK